MNILLLELKEDKEKMKLSKSKQIIKNLEAEVEVKVRKIVQIKLNRHQQKGEP